MVSWDETFCNLQKMLLSGNEISLADASNFKIPFRGKGPTNLICFLTSNSHLDDGQSEGCAVKRSLFTHFFFAQELTGFGTCTRIGIILDFRLIKIYVLVLVHT